MSTSDRIRRAALNEIPRRFADLLDRDQEAWLAIYDFEDGLWNQYTYTERRMFLLFVAEAIDD